MTNLRIGTRRSALAMAQARSVGDGLARAGRHAEIVGVTTQGDRTSASLAQIGGTGVFVSVLRDRLLAGDIDVAVHSLKDLPTELAPGLRVAAVPPREDPRDVLAARDGKAGRAFRELPEGSRVGTGSPRRTAQLRLARPDLKIEDLRGNVDTRLAKVAAGELDAVVLARAGLARLGRLDEATEALDPDLMVPAPGQGALAVECRGDDHGTARLLGVLDDSPTRAAVTAERAVLAALEAGCSAPVGAYAEAAEHGTRLHLRAAVISVDGAASVRLSTTGPLDAAGDLGRGLATDLLAEGAAALMGERVR
ncbi:MAG: hydroxymethylbilane synthase [Streptosporangiaceae bacterium]